MFKPHLILLSLLIPACNSVKIDTSMNAFAAGDYTVPVAVTGTACNAVPALGLQSCRVNEDAQIDESWVLVLPNGGAVESGEITLRYKGQKWTYALTGPTMEIKLRDILGHEHYSLDDDGIMQFKGTLRYKTPSGDQWIDVLGLGMLLVLQKGYSPMPIDSGFSAFETVCKIQYSTAGRAAIQCSGH